MRPCQQALSVIGEMQKTHILMPTIIIVGSVLRMMKTYDVTRRVITAKKEYAQFTQII